MVESDEHDQLERLVRLHLSEKAWLDASHEWLASEDFPDPRPLSLGSLDALRLMDMDVFSEAPLKNEDLAIAFYRWLHTAPLRQVKAALWSGTWQLLFSEVPRLSDEVVATFRAERDRLASMIQVLTIAIRPKPKTPHSKPPPPDVISPEMTTFRIVSIARELSCTPEYAQWHLPLVQALQVYHFAMWDSGRWTVKPGLEVKTEDVIDNTPDFLRDLADIPDLPPAD
jgi:hypothetical protein